MQYSIEFQCPDHPDTWHQVDPLEDLEAVAEARARALAAKTNQPVRVVKIYKTTSVVFKPLPRSVVVI